MRPPTPYYGSKSTLAPWIVSLLPEHTHYVEPFAGSLAALLAKPQSRMETVNDLDGDLMNFWRILRDQPADLVRACTLTPHSRAELDNSWEPTEDDLERARRVWVRLTQGRSGTMRKTGWRHYMDPAGSTLSMPGYLEAYRRRILPVAERLADVSLESRPALELIAAYGTRPGVLLYVDPPYLGSTRGWGANYGVEMRDPEQHRDLAAALWDCTATVLLSGYDSPLYAELYEGWHRTDVTTWTGNAHPGSMARLEVVWSNRQMTGQRELELFDTVPSSGDTR